ncbi:hypothetical protein ABC974_17630 [Sphingomonas oligophenolica]|uniref:Transposase n=1 Tax=Sphingomonas oligophenolica TaxID=301154 RepID=A0ABU9Y6V4_9SPHN
MIYRARFESSSPIELEELVQRVADTIREDDFESMKACAPFLASYARKAGILRDVINNTIEDMLLDRTVAPIRTPQSFILAVHDKFYVRCNIWAPIASGIVSKPFQERLYSLEAPHDHNFSFLTVGYAGPGYKTDIYEYDRETVSGTVGEKVSLRPTGSYVLSPGDVMLYRQGIDVHVQHQPEQYSASLNVMFLSDYSRREWQFLFDLETSTISGLSGSAMRSRHELITLAAELGDAETTSRLVDVSERCPCPRTRQAALVALNTINERHVIS